MDLKHLKPEPHPIKAKLRKAGLTQADVAAFCGVAPAWMGLLLSGHRRPSEAVKVKLEELQGLIED